MTYEVLARKWRPQAFDDVVGQDHVTTPLRNAIRQGRVPHAVLLTGPRGVGKTTIARILARCLNCEKGPTDTPCGECDACREIVTGHSTDVQEIDAASRTSVDDVRELIEAVRYAPTPGKYKIFVVDEVHMLSTAAFNALLKTLEEPPPRSLFLFATTNPEKIPFTVVSRCQRYDLRRIAAAEIVERLRLVCRDEGADLSDESLRAIAREADGSLRDSQTLLDQVIAFGGNAIDDEQVARILDLVDRRLLLGIAVACVNGDPAAVLEACGRAATQGVDAKRLAENLLQLLRDLVVLRIAPEGQDLVEASDAELAELRELAERTEAARLRRMFRALVKEQEDLAWAPQPFAVLEMALVRLATMPAGDDVAKLLSRLEALEKRLAQGGGSGSGPGGGSAASRSGASRRSAGRSEREDETRSAGRSEREDETRSAGRSEREDETRSAGRSEREDETRSAGRSEREDETHSAAVDETHEAAPPEPPPLGEAAPAPAALPDADAPPAVVFDRLRAFVQREHPRLAAALDGGRLLEHAGDRLRIGVSNKFAARRLDDRRDALSNLGSGFFGRPVRVEIVHDAEGATAGSAGADAESVRQLKQNALNHPAIGQALDVLDGEIAEIRPLGPGGPPR